MIDDTHAARLMELLDRRLRGTLSEEQARELDESLRPDTVENRVNTTLDRAADHFDFDLAQRALEQRLKADRTTIRMGAAMLSMVLLAAAVMAWWRAEWGSLIFTLAAMALAPLVWALLTARRRASAKAALAGRLPLENAMVQHRRASARELLAMQLAIICGFVGFAVLVIDSAMDGNWIRLIVGTVMLVLILPIAARRVFSAAGRERRRAFIDGRTSASAWLRGVDEEHA